MQPMTDPRAEFGVSDLADLDLTDGKRYRHGFPHEIFTMLRREAPVWWQAVPDNFTANDDEGFWVLSRYDDIQAANRDIELFSALDGPSLSHNPEMRGTMLVSMDGRDHNRQRRLISAGFTPRMVGRLEAQARRWAACPLVRIASQPGISSFGLSGTGLHQAPRMDAPSSFYPTMPCLWPYRGLPTQGRPAGPTPCPPVEPLCAGNAR